MTGRRIVFDFGGVLFRWQPIDLLQQLLPHHATDEASARHWVEQIFQGYGGHWGEFDRGTIEVPALIDAISGRTGLATDTLQALVDIIPHRLTPIADSVALLERLHAEGAALHYLSNMPAPYARHLSANHDFIGRFASGLYSCDVKMIKPDPAIFDHAARHFEADPATLIFLDDHLPNIEAARGAGWQALHFTDAAQAERDLRAAGWWPG